jgi:hypothetical protein
MMNRFLDLVLITNPADLAKMLLRTLQKNTWPRKGE